MPYTYLIGWSKYNKYYYGARWAKNCDPDDLWNTYFTSSKHVKEFRTNYGEPDIVQIRKIFDNKKQCKIHEYKVLKRLNVLVNDKWLNRNINGLFLPEGPQSEHHIRKRIESTIKTKIKNGTFRKGWTKEERPEAAKKISEKQKGIPKSASHIANMKFHENNKPIHECPHCKKVGDIRNMKRWHFDRCKKNPVRNPDLDKTVTCYKCGHTANQSPNFYKYHNDNCRYYDQSAR